ncbi:MAG TPA: zinc ribbon domain-containing protein [Anaerolineae bacterium]|jgi:putative FmdB family regulatory protein|nr:zinc ribbon domain-containing protein [Anaerolineae bacterium]
MPTYDFICFDCRKRFDIFMTYSEYGVKPVACSHCGSANARRRVPRVRVLKSDEQRLSALGDPSMLDGIDDDPIALGRMMRKMGSELGEDLPPEFGDVVDRLEAGQSPEEIESAIPDLAEGLGGGDMGGLDDGF